MKSDLSSYDVITRREAQQIDKMTTTDDQMLKVIEIVQNSLKVKHTLKFKGLLQAMEENEDTSLVDIAKKFGKQ